MTDNDAYQEYPAILFIDAARSALAFVRKVEIDTGDEFGVGESVGVPLAHLDELLRRMREGEL